MFNKLIWKPDRMLLDKLVFKLELGKDDRWDLGDQCFSFYKDKTLIDQYESYLTAHEALKVKNMVELGIYDGGSLAFWAEYFHPQKIIGIDILQKNDSEYFTQYIQSKHRETNISTYWGVDQGDARKLREIAKTESLAPLDIVIDDASHQYALTKISFETLFPMLRPGGLYFIEDWAWGHWPDWQSPDHPWAKNIEPTRLIFEFVEAVGTSRAVIRSITINQGFVVVERGSAELDPWTSLDINKRILRRPRGVTG